MVAIAAGIGGFFILMILLVTACCISRKVIFHTTIRALYIVDVESPISQKIEV